MMIITLTPLHRINNVENFFYYKSDSILFKKISCCKILISYELMDKNKLIFDDLIMITRLPTLSDHMNFQRMFLLCQMLYFANFIMVSLCLYTYNITKLFYF